MHMCTESFLLSTFITKVECPPQIHFPLHSCRQAARSFLIGAVGVELTDVATGAGGMAD